MLNKKDKSLVVNLSEKVLRLSALSMLIAIAIYQVKVIPPIATLLRAFDTHSCVRFKIYIA